MAGIEGEDRSHRDITPYRNTQQDAEGTLPAIAFFEQLSETPDGVDPAYWPIQVLNQLNAYILNRDIVSDDPLKSPWGINTRALAERFAPLKEHMQRVTTAYTILAYPHCKYEGSRDLIEEQLRAEQTRLAREQIELSDAELQILTKLTAARNLPFDPDKRVYTYDEVFHPSPNIELALSGAQFIKWLGEQKRAKAQGNTK